MRFTSRVRKLPNAIESGEKVKTFAKTRMAGVRPVLICNPKPETAANAVCGVPTKACANAGRSTRCVTRVVELWYN